ncbi:CDP-alcohol phosphatidyltransferase family protein [Actinokineospora bangkokensis]|uniref:CDP-diacylglycerol--glycerol-3-phosphate 3-phosphatidyltransferase n=1 Tax=Actinokineospora bangkokensis TaxID=1193682 RepID=A0A1Q9LR86_9PSEU|nr:CDP-alcohol phosphatidyltransferase family protein [Actinokineospora bangkokensis]OLR94528.1 CDP-diacylglycerol--glycerol-3-phosphate 3-phosphatidyltransferase [Actinokineospora bangkokensis]
MSDAAGYPDRVFTIPNALSVLRLLGVPVFLWLLLGPQADGWAIAVLVFSGVSDWLDGKIARWLDQMSSLGALLDPAADRLYTLATIVAFVLRDIVPLWVAVVLVARDALVGACIWLLRRNGFAPPEVTYIGKAATFNLMYAFPLLLLAQGSSDAATAVRPVAYALAIWGGVLFVYSGLLYLVQTSTALRDRGAPAPL